MNSRTRSRNRRRRADRNMERKKEIQRAKIIKSAREAPVSPVLVSSPPPRTWTPIPGPIPQNGEYYWPLKEAVACLPPGMGLVSGVGGIFTRTWMLLGLEQFCFALAEQPDLIGEIFQRVGTIQCTVLRKVLKEVPVVAVWYGDDLAYTESSMVSPKVYRKYLFPWMEQLAAIAHEAGLPLIFHSDGKLWDVIPDLIALGVNALHPIEPKAMDINQVKARFGDKLALIGNIDMNLLALGTPEQVREQVRQRIKDIAPGGGYAVGANPGIADYVRPENYDAMRRGRFRVWKVSHQIMSRSNLTFRLTRSHRRRCLQGQR